MSKKTKRNSYKINSSSDTEYSKVIKITVIVVLVLVITYLITALATGEIKLGKNKNEEKEETSIQYEEILSGEILNRNQNEYYVMLFNFTDTFASYYLSLKDSYLEKDNAKPFYIVDLEKNSNQNIVASDDASIKEYIDNINDLRVENPTIIRVNNHKVVEIIRGRESILNFFKEQ